MTETTKHQHHYEDVTGFVNGTKQACHCGDYRYPTIEAWKGTTPA